MGSEFSAFIVKPLTWFLGILIGLVTYIWSEHKSDVKNLKKKLEEEYYNKETIDIKLDHLTKAVEENTGANRDVRDALQDLTITIARMNGSTNSRRDT